MNDITALAQREKFEAWWEITYHNGNPPRFGWVHWREGDGYKIDDDEPELDGKWEAWKAASVELVEALEKAQQHEQEWKSLCEAAAVDLDDWCEIDDKSRGLICKFADAVITRNERIASLESRTVKLPPRVDSSNVPFTAHTWNCCLDAVEKCLTAAGIQVIEGEGQ